MIADIECPKPAYEAVIHSGIKKIIDKKLERVRDICLYGIDDYVQKLTRIAKRNFNSSSKINDERELWKEFLEFEDFTSRNEGFVCSANAYELLSKFPCVLGYAVLEEDLLDFERFGFFNRRSLEEAVTSFCIGEISAMGGIFREDSFSWRGNNGNTKNILSHEVHGDLYAGQIDVSGKDSIEQTFFGDVRRFDSLKFCDVGMGVSAHYENWNPFLISALKYAEHLEQKNIPLIKNWKEALESVGGAVGTATTECMLGGGGAGSYFYIERMLEDNLIVKGREISMENHPIYIHAGENRGYYPYVDDTRRMSWVIEDEKGKVELPAPKGSLWGGKKYQKVLEYDADDLPNLLKGIYRLFARDRSELNFIMDRFNGNIPAGIGS